MTAMAGALSVKKAFATTSAAAGAIVIIAAAVSVRSAICSRRSAPRDPPSHRRTAADGYDIIKAIEDQVGGAYSPSAGVVYPTLTMLEELGYVTVNTADGAKKLHTITAEGRAYLDAYRPTVDALLARMAEANRTYGGGPASQILRAMENLKPRAAAPFTRSAQRRASQRRGRCHRSRRHQRGTNLTSHEHDQEGPK